MKKIKLFFIIFSFLGLTLGRAWAEYRVYQYYVSSKYKKPDEQKPYLVTSTLDPVSYLSYHGGEESIKVDLLRTWPCPGHTGSGRPLCEATLESSQEQQTEQAAP